jgi:hypothetical protein
MTEGLRLFNPEFPKYSQFGAADFLLAKGF